MLYQSTLDKKIRIFILLIIFSNISYSSELPHQNLIYAIKLKSPQQLGERADLILQNKITYDENGNYLKDSEQQHDAAARLLRESIDIILKSPFLVTESKTLINLKYKIAEMIYKNQMHQDELGNTIDPDDQDKHNEIAARLFRETKELPYSKHMLAIMIHHNETYRDELGIFFYLYSIMTPIN